MPGLEVVDRLGQTRVAGALRRVSGALGGVALAVAR
jgi:hypothetical protein